MAMPPHTPLFTIDAYLPSSQGSLLYPKVCPTAYPSLIEDERIFSYENYSKEVHSPTALEIDTSALSNQYPRCLDMPIKLAGSDEYLLPDDWQGLSSLITDIISTEHAHNPHYIDYFTYMTVDCAWVEPSQQQRHGGLHVDGFQGERIVDKTKITRNYVLTTNGGTRFFPQTFIVADPKEFNVFQGFDIQAKGHNIAKENTVYFMDAYAVHESGLASHAGMRTFLQVTYDLKKFDRLDNTHNPLLNYSWDMVSRSVHETVQSPTDEDVQASLFK